MHLSVLSFLQVIFTRKTNPCRCLTWSIRPLYANAKFSNTFGEFVHHRKDVAEKNVTKIMSHRIPVFADTYSVSNHLINSVGYGHHMSVTVD